MKNQQLYDTECLVVPYTIPPHRSISRTNQSRKTKKKLTVVYKKKKKKNVGPTRKYVP